MLAQVPSAHIEPVSGSIIIEGLVNRHRTPARPATEIFIVFADMPASPYYPRRADSKQRTAWRCFRA
jgi:hypothetical protein